ncbi:MAG: PrgI family protein [Clostridiales bacterium]|nr:PrgI family protein [Clostridiales bacterium]
MAYVPVPNELTRVKSRFLCNLTKRQVVCFGLGALVGLPLFFLTKGTLGVSMAAALMIVIMLPFFMFAMFERHGQPLEVLLKHFIQARFVRPRTRVYRTDNFYAVIEQNTRNRQEVRKILHGKDKRKAQADPGPEKAAAGTDGPQPAKQ